MNWSYLKAISRYRGTLFAVTANEVGAYDHLGWSVFASELSDNPAIARYVSVHESLHDDLSASTSYGMLLNVFAQIASAKPHMAADVMYSLLDRARYTHECFATCVALLMFDGGVVDALSGAAGDYHQYIRLGEQLTTGITSSFWRYHALVAIARVCMQTEWIQSVVANGFESFLPSARRHRDYPDARLELLSRKLSSQFWRASIEHARLSCGGITLPDASDQDRLVDPSPQASDIVSTSVMISIYDSLCEILAAEGIYPLSFNGHQAFTQQLIAAVDHLLPPGVPRLRAISTESEEQIVIESFGRERLVLHDTAYPMMLTRFADIPSERWNELTSGAGTNEHLFVVSRDRARLSEQYVISGETSMNCQMEQGTVVAVRRSGVDPGGQQRVEYFRLSNPEELTAIVRHFDGDMPVVANVSMASLLDKVFVDTWYAAIHRFGPPTILVDRQPFKQFQLWLSRKELIIHYATLSTSVDGVTRCVFAFCPQAPNSSVFVLPCSETVNAALVYYLQSIVHAGANAQNSTAFVDESAWELQVVLGHLFREEPFFDCMAGVSLESDRDQS